MLRAARELGRYTAKHGARDPRPHAVSLVLRMEPSTLLIARLADIIRHRRLAVGARELRLLSLAQARTET